MMHATHTTASTVHAPRYTLQQGPNNATLNTTKIKNYERRDTEQRDACLALLVLKPYVTPHVGLCLMGYYGVRARTAL